MEAVWDELPSGPPPRERRRFWPRSISEAGAAFATFLLSLAVFSVAGLNAVRGSRIVMIQPEHVTFYRDGEGDASVLALALNLPMVNAASQDYGDVATEVQLVISPRRSKKDAVRFRMDGFAEAVPLGKGQEARAGRQADACPLGARCISNGTLVVTQRPRQLLDVPGGGSRTAALGFILLSLACEGPADACAEFRDFRSASAALQRRAGQHYRIQIRFHGDGVKEIDCRTGADPASFQGAFERLEDKGWATLPCVHD